MNDIIENRSGKKFFLLSMLVLLISIIFFITSLIKFDSSLSLLDKQKKEIQSFYDSKIFELELEIKSLTYSKDSITEQNTILVSQTLSYNTLMDSLYSFRNEQLKMTYEKNILYIDTVSNSTNFTFLKNYLSRP